MDGPSQLEPQAAAASPPELPAAAAAPGELPVSEAERQSLITDVRGKTTSLLDLLRSYQEMERVLKEDITELVVRDMHEHNVHAGLERRVRAAQDAMLQDTAYVAWAARNGKGEFRGRGGADSADAAAGETGAVASSDPSASAQKWGAATTWADSVVAGCAAPGRVPEAVSALAVAALPLATLAVPPCVALVLGGGVSADSEDSTVTAITRTRVASFFALVQSWRAAVEQRVGERCAILLNGVPLLATDAGSAPPPLTAPFEEAAAARLDAWIERASATPVEALFTAAAAAAPSSARDAMALEMVRALLKQGADTQEAMATSATPDADTLALVPLRTVTASAVIVFAVVAEACRGAVFVEPLVPHLALLAARGFANAGALRDRVRAFCADTVLPLARAGVLAKNNVVALAVDGDVAARAPVTLLDVCALSPHLPTTLVTWNDVCSALREAVAQRGDATGGGPTSGGGGEALFRGQKARVASLDSVRDELADMRQAPAAAQSATAARCVLELLLLDGNADHGASVAAAASVTESASRVEAPGEASRGASRLWVGACAVVAAGLLAAAVVRRFRASPASPSSSVA
jgi:hypothetical protein